MLHTSLHTLALVLAVGSPMAEPPLAGEPALERLPTIEPESAPEPAPEPLTIRVEVELSELPARDALRLDREIRSAIDHRLAAEPLAFADDAPHRVVIHVSLVDPALHEYAIDFELHANGIPLDPPLDRLHCRMCAQVEVVEHVTRALPGAIAALRAVVEAPVLDPAVAAELPVLPEPPPPLVVMAVDTKRSSSLSEPPIPPRAISSPPTPPPPRPRIRWLGPAGAIGVVLTIGGTTTVAIATTALHQTRAHEPEPTFVLPPLQGDPEGLAWLLYGTGMAVTAIGGALLATDVTALRKRRARRLTVHPSLTTTHGAIVIHGRF